MATIATLVTQLVAKVEPFVNGINRAEGRFAKFQKSMIGKAGTALFSMTALDKGFDALGQTMKRSIEGGENFVDVLQETGTTALTTLPIIGGLNQAAISLRDGFLGDAAALQEMDARLASVQQRLGLTAAEANRLSVVHRVLTDLKNSVANFGDSSEVAMLKAAGATDKAILSAMLLQGQLETLRRQQENAKAIDTMIRGLEEQADMFGMNAMQIDLYRAALLGASDADLAYIRTLHDKLDAMKAVEDSIKRQNDLMNEGQRITESVRTAQEIYNDTIENLQKLLEAGAISEETFRRAMEKAKDDLEGALKVDEPAIRKNSPADVFQSPAALERRFGQSFRTPAAQDSGLKLLKTAEQTLVDARRQTGYQRRMTDALESLEDGLQFSVYGGLN